MLIYRFNDEINNGPYEDVDEISMLHGMGHDPKKKHHPIPHSDFGIEQLREFSDRVNDGVFVTGLLFGFNSLQQAYSWFTKDEVELMASRGFELNVYDIDKQYIIESSYQVMFKPTGRLISSISTKNNEELNALNINQSDQLTI